MFSYRLSIMHFWSLVFVYIWAGPHHLHYSAIPEWASTLGMLFSLILWMPSWGGMVNGLFTLRGAWHKLREDPILKFMVVAVTYYGMSTFEGPMMSIKSVNAVSHFTDWTIGHVHAGALGWNAFLSFGILYWVVPRLWKTDLYSKKLATTHFWIATVGPDRLPGLDVGRRHHAVGHVARLRGRRPPGLPRLHRDGDRDRARSTGSACVAAILFFSGMLLCVWNLVATIRRAPADYAVEPEVIAPPLVRDLSAPGAVTPANTYDHAFYRLQHSLRHGVHRVLEGVPVPFTVLVVLALAVGSLVEAIPMFFDKENVKEIASVKPYTPLEVVGRDIYIREGCYNCHSQLVRPFRFETERYGEYSKAGEYVYDRPFQWGSKRTGPDLHRVGAQVPVALARPPHAPARFDDTGVGDAALPAPADQPLRHQPHRLEDARAAQRWGCPTPTERSRRRRRTWRARRR